MTTPLSGRKYPEKKHLILPQSRRNSVKQGTNWGHSLRNQNDSLCTEMLPVYSRQGGTLRVEKRNSLSTLCFSENEPNATIRAGVACQQPRSWAAWNRASGDGRHGSPVPGLRWALGAQRQSRPATWPRGARGTGMRKYSCFSKAAPLVKGLECLPKDRGVYQGSPDTVGRGGGRLLCPSLPPPHVTVVRMLARSLKSRSSP